MAAVLIVEDRAALRILLRELLTRAGYTTRDAGSIPEALAELQRPPHPDVAVLDLTLPGGPGESLIVSLHRRGAKVLVLSGAWDGEARALAAGADAFVPKPFETTALLHRVAHLAGQPN